MPIYRAITTLVVVTAATMLVTLTPRLSSAAQGDVDPTFTVSITGGTPTVVRAMAVQPDGKIVIGGDFTTVDGQLRPGLARLEANGSLDTTFAPTIYFSQVHAIHLAANGDILIGGQIYLSNFVSDLRQLVWIAPDGSTVRDIDLSSTLYYDDDNVVFTMLVEDAGSIVIGGRFYYLQDTLTPGVARISAAGVVDPALGVGAGLQNDISGQLRVQSLARQADGKLVVAGQFLSGTRRGLVRLNADDTVDQSFASTGTDASGRINAVAIESDGQILVSGNFNDINSTFTPKLARLRADGALNLNHASVVLFYMGAPQTMRLQDNGQILLGGVLGPINNTNRNGIARFNPDFTLDPFYPNPNGVNGQVTSIGIDGAGRVLIGGFFSMVGGLAKPTMARLLDVPNSLPQLNNLSLTSAVNEGGSVTLTGDVSDVDAGALLAVTINWGDGTSTSLPNLANGSSISSSHQYADDNPTGTSSDAYSVNVSLTDGQGGSDSDTLATTVNNLAPSLSNVSASPATINAGSSVTLSATVGDAGTLDPLTVSISWGDGTTNSTLNLAAGSTSFSTTHQYDSAGGYTVGVAVSDDDLGSVTNSTAASVTVNAVQTAPAAPLNVNGIVTVTRSGKTRIYNGSLTWTDNSTNETNFLVQRLLRVRKACALDTAFGTIQLPAGTTSYADPTPTASTCGYQVAAQNTAGTSSYVRDIDVGAGVTP